MNDIKSNYYNLSMEQSDNMLITTLKEYINISENIITLKDIRAEEIFTISLGILEYLKVDVNQVKLLSGKTQRFRAMAKLSQSLYQQLQTQFQMNQLMNPSIPFLRKYFLTIINKLGSGESTQKVKGKKQVVSKRQQKKQLKAWINSEWIHPSLGVNPQKYKGYILPLTINKNLLKNKINLSAELNNQFLSHNVQSILNLTVAKHNQRVKQFEANEGISRREEEQAAVRMQTIVKANKDDWAIKDNKLQKLKRKIIQPEEETSMIAVPQVVSVFKRELQDAEIEAEKKKAVESIAPDKQVKTEIQQVGITLNPLQLLKQQAQSRRQQRELQIRQILNELKERKDAIEQWQRQKAALQNEMANDEQKIAKLKQETVELKKKVQKRQVILTTLEGQKDVQQEVKKLEAQITMITQQVQEEVQKVQTDIKSMKVQSKQKIQALSQIKIKLNKVQTDYQRICQEITQKQELKGGVKIMKSGISRLYYHKKISEMEARWKETAKQTKKLKASLEELREKTRISATLNIRLQTQIQNVLSMNKDKNQPENKLLKQLMLKCKNTFQTTLKTLEQANQIKLQAQQYEMKIHSLSGKNYKQNIQKIGFALQDLKKQIAQISRSKLK